MFNVSRIVAIVTLHSVILGSATTLAGEARVTSQMELDSPAGPVQEIIAPDASWSRLADWAIDRFDQLGLELPAAKISFHEDKAACQGNDGLYSPGPIPAVNICVDVDPGSKIARLILLHELGHLWAENVMSDEVRDAFLAVRGLDAWTDGELPPHEWGAEHAAEVLSWGLMDEPVRIIRIYNASQDALAEAFVVLTGATPLVQAATSGS